MQRSLTKAVEVTVIWIIAALLLFLFFSPRFLALNLFKIDPSFLLVPSLSMVLLLFSSSVASVAIEKSPHRKIANKWLRILAFSVFVFLVSKNVVDDASAVLPQGVALVFYLSLSSGGGLIWLSLGSLFTLLKNNPSPVISSASWWISQGLTRNFALGFLVTAYLSSIRRPLIELSPYVAIAEWVATALVVAIIYLNTKMVTEESNLDLEGVDWRKHTQEVERKIGDDFEHLTFVQEQFVNQGTKESLLIYLTLLLHDLGEDEQQIMRTLAPLLDYRDKRPSILALPLVRKSFKRKNNQAKKKILEDLMTKIVGR